MYARSVISVLHISVRALHTLIKAARACAGKH